MTLPPFLAEQFLRVAQLQTGGRAPDFIVGGADNPYLRRWWITPRDDTGACYLHQFLRSDDDRALHDHRYASTSIILRGSYVEHPANGSAPLRSTGEIIIRDAVSPHRVELLRDAAGREMPCWTLFLCGQAVRDWGFHCPQGCGRGRSSLMRVMPARSAGVAHERYRRDPRHSDRHPAARHAAGGPRLRAPPSVRGGPGLFPGHDWRFLPQLRRRGLRLAGGFLGGCGMTPPPVPGFLGVPSADGSARQRSIPEHAARVIERLHATGLPLADCIEVLAMAMAELLTRGGAAEDHPAMRWGIWQLGTQMGAQRQVRAMMALPVAGRG